MQDNGIPWLSDEECNEIRREAIEFAGIGLYRYEFDGTLMFIDRGAMRILDLEGLYKEPSELVGKNIGNLIIYTGPKGFLRQQIREHGYVKRLEYPFRTLTGKEIWALHDSYLVVDQATGREMIQVIIKDITERKVAELALSAERERLAVTLRSIGDGVITTDVNGRVTMMNKVAEQLTGWSQADAGGRPLQEVFRIVNEKTRVPCESPVERVMSTGSIVGLANHTALISKDGRERVIADSGAPIRDHQSRIIGVVLVFRDVTEKQRIEDEMRRVEKLESVGVLAGGIAHDFNNLLSAILGNVSLAQLYSKPGGPVAELLTQTERATLRAKELTHQLLTFAKGGAPVKSASSIANIIRESVAFALTGSPSRCEFHLAADLSAVEVDPNQMSQVIHNLVLNAHQAMPIGGKIDVWAENVNLTPEERIPLPPGRFVRIRVQDEGIGIPPDELARVFDPYYTTKQQGSGLGLTVSHSIVAHHDGHITVESSLGKGTTFTVYLPASDVTPRDERPDSAEPILGNGRILVLEDEEAVRDVMQQMLSHMGYRGEFTPEGSLTVAKYQQALGTDQAFDAVILDLTIPGGVGGAETLRRLLALDPEVVAIASSGYSSDPIMADHKRYGFKAVLAKPYSIMDFSQTLHDVLSAQKKADS